MEEKLIIALEIGSSKIKGATGSVGPDGALNVKAVEEEPISDIVRYGCIRNIVETAQAVRNVISRLEQREAPNKLEGVYLSIGGRSLTAQSVDIEKHLPTESIITEEIIRDITREAIEYPLIDRTVVDVTPRELLIDNISMPKPVGALGSHILARLNIVHCRPQLLRNLTVVIEERLGLKIMDTFVRPLAIADLVLLNEEKRLGCMLVDFGAETTTVAIYRNGVLQHLAVLPMGSRNITRDITALNYLEEEAEELKCQRGSALPTHESKPGQPDFVAINNYASARAGEIIVNIAEQVKYAGLTPEKLAKGIVIVGRGARLNDFNRRLEQLTGMTVRTGAPGNRIRILDGRIQASDSVDVIAILNKAAQSDPQQCMSAIRAARPAAEYHAAQPQTGYTQPQQPTYAQPQQPTYAQPQQPAYAQPRQPIYNQPQQPTYAQPQQPVYNQPQQPVAPATPQQPVYGQQPQQPAAPTTPQQPVYGQQPQQPAAPVTPQQPVYNQQPATPVTPQQPQEALRPTVNPGNPPTPVPVNPPVTPTSEPESKGKKPNKFIRGYNALVNKVANIISDGFEEEEDDE